jgi:ribosome-binding protein aMBF1 (putative translation factor)
MAKAKAKPRGKGKGRQPMSPLAASLVDGALAAFKDRVERERKERGWFAKDLAAKAGMSESKLSRIGAENQTLWGAIAIARAFGVRVGWLVAGELPKYERLQSHPNIVHISELPQEKLPRKRRPNASDEREAPVDDPAEPE